MHILITSGGTREYIDPVRFISNASSGKMGLALALAALKAGHKVTLITTVEKSNIKEQKSKLRMVTVQTAAQMFEAVKKHFPHCDCLVMAAAVADYTPARPAKTKFKKQHRPLTIKLKPTVDILKWAGKHKTGSRVTGHGSRIIVGFALEDRDIRRRAEQKLREKNLDMIIVNTPAAIGADKTSVQIKMPGRKWLRLPKASKAALAKRIVSLAANIQNASRPDGRGKIQIR